jgi:hypothetical protein
MAWENIEERLKTPFTLSISFPVGTIWFPEKHLTIDDWLISAAQSDEEFKELSIRRIQFLQNRWPIEQLLQLRWDDPFSSMRAVSAVYVAQRAYILLSDWNDYQVIAAVEPKNAASLYQFVIGKILASPNLMASPPARTKVRRPDLLPRRTSAGGFAPTEATALASEPWKNFLSEIFVGWIGRWLNVPESVAWNEDETKAA